MGRGPAGRRANPRPSCCCRCWTAIQNSEASPRARMTAMSYRPHGACCAVPHFESEFGAYDESSRREDRGRVFPRWRKRLWADRRVAARLSPTLESCSSELEGELESCGAGARKLAYSGSHCLRWPRWSQALGTANKPVDLKYAPARRAWLAGAGANATWPASRGRGCFRRRRSNRTRPGSTAPARAESTGAPDTGMCVASGIKKPKGVDGWKTLDRPDLRFGTGRSDSATRIALLSTCCWRATDRTGRIVGY